MTDDSPVDQSEFDALLELLDGDSMREVVTMFATSAPVRVATATEGLAALDAKVAATAFHTLRSSCGQLGAAQLEAFCANAERAAKQGDFDGAGALLEQVRTELARCLAWFGERGWIAAGT